MQILVMEYMIYTLVGPTVHDVTLAHVIRYDEFSLVNFGSVNFNVKCQVQLSNYHKQLVGVLGHPRGRRCQATQGAPD
jgi:hypothetical protein